MPREQYQTKLEALRDDVLFMSELVADRLRTALDALARHDAALGETVITGDTEVNELYLELEQQCTDLIALQQPVAGDLRFIAASFKIITDLERVGDLATNLAAYGRDDGLHPALEFRGLAQSAGDMLTDAMAAYETGDVDACYRIAARDEDLDERCRRASQAVLRHLVETDREREGRDRSPEALAAGLEAVSSGLLAVRDVERVGDHAVNVAARTLYMAENDDELLY